jgi:hypothetical protein
MVWLRLSRGFVNTALAHVIEIDKTLSPLTVSFGARWSFLLKLVFYNL